jgi:hypothetical protein
MQDKGKILLITVCGLIFALAPFSFVKAQNSNDEDPKAELKETESEKADRERAERKRIKREIRERKEKEEARAEISGSVAGKLVLDAASVNAPDWELTRGAYSDRSREGNAVGTYLDFSRGDEKVAISIREYPSLEAAMKVDGVPLAGGRGEKDDRFGESGERIEGENGVFGMLKFRLGNYRVIVVSRNEKNAEQFAAYISQTLRSLTGLKQK